MKKLLNQVFFLIVLQGLIGVSPTVVNAADFLNQDRFDGAPLLRWDTKIPAGSTDRIIYYVTLPKGTPLSEIPLKISQKREEVGLSPDIPADEQNEFLQSFPWKTAKAIFLKSPLRGTVFKMDVQKGQQVARGFVGSIVEAMKMEHRIRTQSQGEVRNIFFKVGDLVDCDSDLVSYMPSNPDWEDIGQEKILDNKDFLILLFPWAKRTPPRPSHAPSPNRGWKDHHQPEILKNKNFMVLLYPWATWSPSTPLNTSPPNKGFKSGVLKTLSRSETHQQALAPREALPPGVQNSILDHSDHKHKTHKDNAKITHEKAEKKPSIWQDNKVSFQQKGIQRDDFKNTSGISNFTWAHWVCGLVVLNKLAFALKSLGCSLLTRIRLKKYSFIVSAFPRTAYLRASDCNKHPFVKNQTAHNMNRLYFVRRKFA